MQANPGTLVEEASWRDVFKADLPSSLFDVYQEEAPPGITREILELGYWLVVEPEAFRQETKR